MDGPKRLAFTTLDPVKKQSGQEKKVEKTIRLVVDLLDSTDTTYPEFSYTDLVKSATGGDRTLSTNSEDPFGDDDADQLAAIAKRFEDKYNKPNDGKKSKKKKWQDNHYMLELGDGYDESDTFIDNSEAYDEIMPENMTTKLGGFYINSGLLTLKEVSDDSEDDFQPEKAKKTKKRRISSDEDSDGEGQKKVVKKKKIKDSLAVDGEVKKKKKKKISPPGEEKPFKKPKLAQDKEKKKENKSSTVAALIKSSSPNLNGEGQENGVGSPPENGEHEDHQSVTDAIEAVAAAAGKEDSNSQDSEEPKKDIDPESIPKLPMNLPAGMDAKIDELKNQAKQSRDGKCKFFTTDVNKILLEVEIASKQMTVGSRSAMFGHLAAFLPCSKDTLMKRAKGLRVKDLEDKIKEPIEKLKQAVNRLMPALQEKYDEECKKFAQEKLANEQKEQQEKQQEKDETNKEENQTESDEEEGKTNQSDTTKKRQTGPRKKFEWDNNTRTLLCDVVRVKMQTFQLSKGRSETAEEFCKAFLDRDVRPIWPKGWMQKVVLFRESRPAHASWTNPQKQKKILLVNKTPGSTTTGNPTQKSNTTSSAPPGISVSKLGASNTAKTNSTLSEKSTPASVNSSKLPSSQGTPNVGVKKITPTLLNYDSAKGSPKVSNNSSTNNVNVQKHPAHSATISNVSPKGAKPSDAKQSTTSPKQSEKSWDHIVSDILRSEYTAVANRTSPSKPNTNQLAQKQASPAEKASSFMAQFEKFTKNAIQSGMDLSPKGSTQAQQQLIQKQVQQRIAQDKALQQLRLLEKQAKLQNQGLPKSTSSTAVSVQQQRPSGNQAKASSHSPMSLGNQSKVPSQSPTSMGNQSKIPNQSPVNLMNQSKIPSQSPMSMAMGRNPAQKVTPKQLSNIFQQSQEAVALAENVIKQQLESRSGNMVNMSSSAVNKFGAKQTNLSENIFGRVPSTADQLRKTSPQVSPVPVISSQAKLGHGHVIKVTTTKSIGQAQVLHSSNPAVKTVTTNGKSTPNLSQPLFNLPTKGTSNNSVPSSITSPGSIRQTAHSRSPGSLPSGGSALRGVPPAQTNLPSFLGGKVSSPTGFAVPNQPLPGLSNAKLQSLTNQIAMFKEVAKQQQQQQLAQQRSADNMLGGNRPPSGPPRPHLSPEQHLHALQYGFSRYKDSMK